MNPLPELDYRSIFKATRLRVMLRWSPSRKEWKGDAGQTFVENLRSRGACIVPGEYTEVDVALHRAWGVEQWERDLRGASVSETLDLWASVDGEWLPASWWRVRDGKAPPATGKRGQPPSLVPGKLGDDRRRKVRRYRAMKRQGVTNAEIERALHTSIKSLKNWASVYDEEVEMGLMSGKEFGVSSP